ncbi:hypothetical protein M885DRAFT_135234 [Pelagophyceae sp. CCMP2097]|nr:hypothetical protein M885DRAFT_135234 [Pelagophyceae sp. CCMP2097]
MALLLLALLARAGRGWAPQARAAAGAGLGRAGSRRQHRSALCTVVRSAFSTAALEAGDAELARRRRAHAAICTIRKEGAVDSAALVALEARVVSEFGDPIATGRSTFNAPARGNADRRGPSRDEWTATESLDGAASFAFVVAGDIAAAVHAERHEARGAANEARGAAAEAGRRGCHQTERRTPCDAA